MHCVFKYTQAMDMAQNALHLAQQMQHHKLEAAALINVAEFVGPTPKSLKVCGVCAARARVLLYWSVLELCAYKGICL